MHFKICFMVNLFAIFTATSGLAARNYGNGIECGQVVKLGLNESFTIRGFPSNRLPLPWSLMPCHSPYACPLDVEECTLEIVSDGEGGCVLEFHAMAYERGDIQCEKQYLLLGDENREKRICGFEKPPPLFRSSGHQLFLTHFRRNENGYRTVPSYLDGVVRCLKERAPGDGGDPCKPVSKCRLSDPFGPLNTGVKAKVLTTSADTPGTSNVNLTCSQFGCVFNGNVCNVVQPCGGGSQLPLSPLPSDCKRALIPCENPVGCNWTDISFANTVMFDHFDSACNVTAGELCTHIVTACLSDGF